MISGSCGSSAYRPSCTATSKTAHRPCEIGRCEPTASFLYMPRKTGSSLGSCASKCSRVSRLLMAPSDSSTARRTLSSFEFSQLLKITSNAMFMSEPNALLATAARCAADAFT